MTAAYRARGLLSVLCFPPRCAVCDGVVPLGQGALCSECAGQLPETFLALERCPHCDKLISACICRSAPELPRCLSAMLYSPATKKLIELLKAGDPTVADHLARLMAARWQSAHLPAPDTIVFIPARPERYNQAAALGERLGALLGVKVLPDPLLRQENSRVQHTLSLEERRRNADLSYALNGAPILSGRILLIDDIITTGATLSCCTRLLLQAGAQEVFCLTAATTLLRQEPGQGR